MFPEIPDGVDAALYVGCMVLAALIIGWSKAGFGGGIGVVAVPVMAMAFPNNPTLLLGVMLPLLIAGDVLSWLHYLREQEWRLLKPLLIGAMAGIVIGAVVLFLLQQMDTRIFQRGLTGGIGAICLIFVGMQVYALTGRPALTLPPRSTSSLGVGTLCGFVSTLAHSGGTIATIYLLQERLDKRRLVGTLLLMFLLVNLAKVPLYVHLNVITHTSMVHAAWFVPLVPLGTLSGAWMNRKLPHRPFVMIMYTAATLTAARMLWNAIMG